MDPEQPQAAAPPPPSNGNGTMEHDGELPFLSSLLKAIKARLVW